MKFKMYLIILATSLFFTGCTASDTLQAATPTATPQPQIEEWLSNNTTIQVQVPTEIESTNPFFVFKKDTMSLFNLIYEPLIKLNEANEPMPYLAKSWKVDEEGTTWTFIIRDGVYWQNSNRELNAQDVIFTLDLMDAIKKESIHCEVMGYIKKWSRIDDRTFEITTYEPFYGFLMAMDFPILPYEVGFTSGVGQAQMPVGTGPFYVTDYRPGVRIELEANEHWWKTLPEITKIIAEPYDDPALALSALTLGQIDVMSTDVLAVTQIREGNSINAFEYMTNYYEFLMPNIGSNILLRDIDFPQGVLVTITRCDSSPNLSEAKIYVSVMPDKKVDKVFVYFFSDIIW